MIRFFTHKNIILYRVMFSLLLSIRFLGAQATVYNVNNTADGNGLNQLRGAILNADATAGPHTINVASGTYLLTLGSIVFGNSAQNITILGTNATIEMSLVSATNRIFLINPPGTVAGVVTSISGCTFKNGRLTSDPFGGGAILCGGPTNSMTINNCLFTGNTINPAVGISNGGAISHQGGGSLTITNTRFENNNVQFGSGGAVDYFLQNFVNLTGSVNITGCTFEGNTANVSAGAVGGALQIALQGAVSGQSFSGSITKNEFLTNAAKANGGAIYINNSFSAGNTIMVNYNRFKGNTSPENPNTSGLAMANTVGNVNAENNWWACNAGPTGPAGCDKAAQLAGAATGIFDASPWLQLRASASPATICNNSPLNTSTVTASFLNNSDGGAVALGNLTVLIGKPISFTNAVLGNISGAQANIQASGTATALFTATASGSGSVNAVVDNVPNTDAAAKASITIRQYPVITQQPVSDVKCLGVTASFSVQNIGTDPVYQWRKGVVNLVNGVTGTGSTLSGVNSATLQISNPSPADAASDYNVVISNACSTATSNNVSLTVNLPPTITNHPAVTTTQCSGTTFNLSAAATGTPTLVYQWRRGNTNLVNGATGTGSTISGAGTSSLSITNIGPADAAANYNVTVSNTCSTVISNNASLTVNVPPSITAQPAITTTQCSGTNFNITVAATGTPAPAFQWRKGITNLVNGPTGTGSTISGVGTNSLTITNISPADAAADYNVSVSNTCSTVISNNASLAVNVPPTFTVQPPANNVGCSGYTFDISATATGTATITYKWRKGVTDLVNGPTGTGSVISGAGTNNLVINFLTPADNASDYNVVATNGCASIPSDMVLLEVQPPDLPTVTSTGSINISSTMHAINDPNCDRIALVVPSGASPVFGLVNGKVTITPTIQVAPPANKPYVNRHYDLEPANNAAAATATVTLYFLQSEFDLFNAYPGVNFLLPESPTDDVGKTNLRIYQYHGTGTLPGVNYTGDLEIINPADDQIIWNATYSRWEVTFDVNGFSGFYASNEDYIILPLNGLEFSGNRFNEKVNLQWLTRNEINTRHFDLERSADGRQFDQVTRVAANGSSTSQRQYQYTDYPGNQPVWYYRLKVVDMDGSISYSKVIMLKSMSTGPISVAPNPFKSHFQVTIRASENSKVQFRLTDVSGRVLRTQTNELMVGQNAVMINNLDALPSGTYLLQVMTNKTTETIKLLKGE